MIIYLIGPRASGKSTLAAALAQRLGCAWVDTDTLVLEASVHDTGGMEGMEGTVAGIVQREGWAGFRRRESAALRAAQAQAASPLPHSAQAAHRIIATGGGMVEDEGNRHFMRATGLVLRLNAPAQVLCARADGDEARAGTTNAASGGPVRPPLLENAAGVPVDSRREMEEILRRRDALYAHAAHHELDAQRPVQDLCAEVLALLAENR